MRRRRTPPTVSDEWAARPVCHPLRPHARNSQIQFPRPPRLHMILGLRSAHPCLITRSEVEYWTENCPPSTNASGYNIVDDIRTIANQFGALNTFKAYLQLPDKSSPRQPPPRSELQPCGLSLTGPSATFSRLASSLISRRRLSAQWKELGRLDDDRWVVSQGRKRCSSHTSFSGYHGVHQGH